MARTLILLLIAFIMPAFLHAQDYPDKTKLLVYHDAAGQQQAVRTPGDWARRRAHILANMERVMGPLPRGVKPALDVRVEEEVRTAKYVRKKITYLAGPAPDNRVPAYLLVPHERPAKAPAVLCLHPTSKFGKAVPAGLQGKEDRHYAHHLAERGYVTLAPDYVRSGEYAFGPYEHGFASATMLGIWNHMRAIDVLETLREVDRARIGVLGHSLGGHNAMFVAAFDERLRCVVSNCGFCSFPTYMKGNLKGWSHDGYMPRLRTDYGLDPAKVPFDFPEVVATLAPRPFLASAPVRDHNFRRAGSQGLHRGSPPGVQAVGR